MRVSSGKRRLHPRRKSERGFTLIEVMISILLAAVTTTGVIGLYSAVTKSSSYSRHATEASILAEDQMERLRTQPLPTTTTTANDGGTIDERGRVTTTGIYTRSWTITLGATDATMLVTVSWNEDGATRSVVLRSKRSTI